MFSSMIQNLLSSSGKASAMQRAVQMNNYVNTLNAQWAPVEKQNTAVENQQAKIQSFENVLKNSTGVNLVIYLHVLLQKLMPTFILLKQKPEQKKYLQENRLKILYLGLLKSMALMKSLLMHLLSKSPGLILMQSQK